MTAKREDLKKKENSFERVLRLGVFVACLSGFVAVEFQQWVLYSSGATSTTVKLVSRTQAKFPFLVFCHRTPFTESIFNPYNTKENFDRRLLISLQ